MAVWIERFESNKDGALERINDLVEGFSCPQRYQQQMTLDALTDIAAAAADGLSKVHAWELEGEDDR